MPSTHVLRRSLGVDKGETMGVVGVAVAAVLLPDSSFIPNIHSLFQEEANLFSYLNRIGVHKVEQHSKEGDVVMEGYLEGDTESIVCSRYGSLEHHKSVYVLGMEWCGLEGGERERLFQRRKEGREGGSGGVNIRAHDQDQRTPILQFEN